MIRCQFLLEFLQLDLAHTGESIGKWLIDSQTLAEYDPYFIGRHVVDGAINAGKSIEVLWSSTSVERSSMIFSAKYDTY